ncbi:unnamed protein product [Mucor hiemalis]
MEKDTEKHSKCDDKKIISVGSKPVKRDQSRCCFGLLSLRSGIYVVSVASFIFSLYGLHDGPSTSEEDLDIIRSVPQWANSAFLCLSFCTEATGLYGAYKKSARFINYYKRLIGLGLGLELACVFTAFKDVYMSRNGELLDTESLVEWVRNSGQSEARARKFFYVIIICSGTVGVMVPVAIEVRKWLRNSEYICKL